MLRRLGFIGAAAAGFALSCGGQSELVERRAPVGEGGVASISRGGTAGCTACDGGKSDGDAGGRSASGHAGAETGGAPDAGVSESGAPTVDSSAGADATAGRGGAVGAGTDGKAGRGGQSGGEAGTNGSANAGTTAGVTDQGGAAGEGAAAALLGITKVAVYQATEVTLMKDGSNVMPNAPVVGERDALVRVWLAPGSGWTARDVTADLTVTSGGGSRTATDTLSVSAASVDTDLASTLTFSLRSSEVSDSTTLSVVLHEMNGSAKLNRWPKTGEYALDTSSSNGDFLVTLVPLIAAGFTPDLGTQTVSRFQRYLSHVYPVSGVDMMVRAPVTLDVDVEPDGTGWDDALDVLYATRDADDPAANVYYFGVLTPGPTLEDYCGGNCVVGLSTVAARTDEGDRGAIGTGYFESNTDTFSQETMAHELGHALGREHAPCGNPDSVDPKYPYPEGQIGVLGYDGTNLLDEDDYKDEMSYCVPVWISDYTWSGIFSRINYVNGLGARRVASAPAERKRYRTLTIRADGRLHWGSERAPPSAPDGEPLEVDLLDAKGAVLGVVNVPFARFDHLPGGFASVPSAALAAPDVASVRVNGEVLPVR
jgi:hypothetical protein